MRAGWTPLLAGVVWGASGMAWAAPGVDAPIVLARERTPLTSDVRTIQVEVDAAGYRKLWDEGGGRVVDFPLPGGQAVSLTLGAFRVVAPGARFVNVDERGSHEVSPPAVRFLRGQVDGDPDSSVVLGLFENRLIGSLRLRDAAYGIGPRELALGSPHAMEVRVWDRSTEVGGASCSVQEVGPGAMGSPALPASPLGAVQLRVDFAMDSTTEWCAHFGNDSNAAQVYLLAVAAQISTIYDAEVSEVVEVPFLRTFCGAADPWTDGLTLLANRARPLFPL